MKSFQFIMLLALCACSSNPIEKKSTAQDVSLSRESLLATNWFQTAGEARALYLQGYNFAKLSFKEALKKKATKPRAVVVDIDETILDNSPYQAKVIEKNTGYPHYWKEWIELEAARPLPGALDFLKFVEANGGVIFYITNRKDIERASTLKNLKKFGFPMKNESQLLVRTDKSDKSDRRAMVRKDHEIVLLVGANLGDFDGIFDGKSVAEKEKLVDQMKNDFGSKLIMLPNPLYGDWEGALYDYNFKLSEKEKHKRRMEALEPF